MQFLIKQGCVHKEIRPHFKGIGQLCRHLRIVTLALVVGILSAGAQTQKGHDKKGGTQEGGMVTGEGH